MKLKLIYKKFIKKIVKMIVKVLVKTSRNPKQEKTFYLFTIYVNNYLNCLLFNKVLSFYLNNTQVLKVMKMMIIVTFVAIINTVIFIRMFR